MTNSLYIHIPFCDNLCRYCDFPKLLAVEKFKSSYMDMLIQELTRLNLNKLKTVFIGGGTPSALTVLEILPLLKQINNFLDTDCEFTIEANIESLNIEKLRVYNKYGVNRLSLGVQSFNEDVLLHANRFHSESDVAEIIKIAREVGFKNINIDLIYGLPKQSFEIWKRDIATALTLRVEHISAYALSIAPGTEFFIKKITEIDQDESRRYYDYLLDSLRKNGYERYEVSNFAKSGYVCKHNSIYWTNGQYYGIGLGACSHVDNERWTNTKNILKYIKGDILDSKEKLSLEEQLEEFLLLNLRTIQGFSLKRLYNLFPRNLCQKVIANAQKLIQAKLLFENDSSIICTDEGFMILNYILLNLICE